MKPINIKTTNCESKSSNCIIWDGPDIDCISLCNGDTVTHAVYYLASKLCEIMDQLDVSNYDLKCLQFENCVPKDFKGFINILITKLCDVAANGGGSTPSVQDGLPVNMNNRVLAENNDCPNCYVELAPCFRYPDQNTGDTVTVSLIQDYVKRIASTVCEMILQITTLQNTDSSFASKISALETAFANQTDYQLPKIFPVSIGSPSEAMSLDVFVQTLEEQFSILYNAVGSPTEIYNAITTPPSDMNTRPALGTGGGTMGAKDGWVSDPANVANTLTNLWIVYLDLYSAVRNIQLNCCNGACDDIELVLNATLESRILKLFFTGSIPANLDSCVPGGSMFKIADASGNYINVQVDIKNNMNNVSGFSIDLNSTPLNFADDLTVTSVFCFNDTTTGSVCQNYLEKIVSNNLDCPTLNLTPGYTSVTFDFLTGSGTLTYSVQLFNSANVMVQSQNVGVSGVTTISGTFSSLDYGATYKIRIQMITASNTKSCPFVPFTTLPNPCAAPTGVSAIFA